MYFRNATLSSVIACLMLMGSTEAGEATGRARYKLGDKQPDATGRPVGAAFAPGVLIVGFKGFSQRASLASVHAEVGATLVRQYDLIPADVVRLAKDADMGQAIKAYQSNPAVAYVQPSYRLHALALPNDPLFGDLWGMRNTGQEGGVPGADIGVQGVWDTTTGSSSVVVGVIDTGVDYTHPDLADNIWENPLEAAGVTGVDDDGNGIIDDIHGARWTNGDGTVTSGDPMDDNSHGTHCSGTIGGVGNNARGVAGVNWTVRIMGLKFLSGDGGGYTADAVSALEYAIAKGADLTSNSWGGGGFEPALQTAILAARDQNQLFIAAAGNDYGNDNDLAPTYPSGYPAANIIAVASVTRFDTLSVFSNIGSTTVDIAAPGSAIVSTVPGAAYDSYDGTSMATPHVAGAAALLLSAHPTATYAELKSWLLGGAVSIPALAGKVLSGGRLNLADALAISNGALGPIQSLAANSASGSDMVNVSWLNPTSPQYSKTILRRSTTGFPASPTDGTLAYQGTATLLSDGPFTLGDTIYYTAWAQSGTGTYSAPRNAIALVGGILNDDCVNAIPIALGETVTGSTTDANASAASSCIDAGSRDVWYSFTPDADGAYRISLCGSSYDTMLQVRNGCSGATLACADDSCGLQTEVCVTLTTGNAYVIRVAGYGNSAGDYQLTVTDGCTGGEGEGEGEVQPNDECANAIAVPLNTPIVGTTVGATASGGASCIASYSKDVWYRFTPATSGEYTVSLCDSDFDTQLEVLNACGGIALACADDVCGLQTSVCVSLNAGVGYPIRVAGFSSLVGNYVLEVTAGCDGGGEGSCVDSPYEADDPYYQQVIGVDPYCCYVEWDGICQEAYDFFAEAGGPGFIAIAGRATVEDGDAVTMSAFGTAGTYQWYKNYKALPGKTSATLSYDPVIVDDAGIYSVTVETGAKTLFTSTPFVLVVLPSGALPLGGLGALVLLTAGCATAGVRRLRRR